MAPLIWKIDILPFIASETLCSYITGNIHTECIARNLGHNKYDYLGDIVHTECTDPEPLHCRHSADNIQHAPHFDGIKQALLGEFIQRIGKIQKHSTLKISCL